MKIPELLPSGLWLLFFVFLCFFFLFLFLFFFLFFFFFFHFPDALIHGLQFVIKV